MGILDRLFRRDASPKLEQRDDACPKPRGPGWYNGATGLGTKADRHVRSDFIPPGPLDRYTLDGLYRHSAILARIIDRLPDDATRTGFALEGFEPDDADALLDRLETLGALDIVADADRWARLYGGALVIAGVNDGRTFDEPLDVSNIRDLHALHVVDRFEVTVEAWDQDPGSRTFLQPLRYRIGSSTHGTDAIVHASRAFRFVGVRLPPRLTFAEDGFGGSIPDRVWAALRNWATTHEQAAEAIGLLTQGVISLDGYANLALRGKEGADAIADRLGAILEGRGLFGELVIDGRDSYSVVQRPIAGMKDALDAFTSALVASTDMPRELLTGETPGGLNSGANAGAIRSWYDHVEAERVRRYTPAIDWLVGILAGARLGPTLGREPDAWRVVWESLWQTSDSEAADVAIKRAQARQIDIGSGVVTIGEARRQPDVRESYALTDDDDAAAAATALVQNETAQELITSDLLETDAHDDDEAEQYDGAPQSIEPPPNERLVSARSVGDVLGVSPAVIRGMHKRGQIRGWKIGAGWRFAVSDVRSAVAKASAG